MPPDEHLETPDADAASGRPLGEGPVPAPVGGRIVDLDSLPEAPAVEHAAVPRQRTPDAGTRPVAPGRPSRRAGPLSRYLLVLAVVGVGAAIYLTARQPDTVAVFVATRDLPAYHVITADDVTLGTRDAGEAEKYADLPVEGRLSLKPIARDQPLRRGDVAPDVAQVLGDDLTVHGFEVSPATVLGGALQPGHRIQLLLVRDRRVLARLDAVVLSVTGGDPAPTRTLVVALRARDAKANEVAVGTGTAVVLRDPAAADAPA
ncbi:SAF domain-containing protein [Phytohabitans sp. ZYX-F-186]|uniref:SAF domain-containing protein n=1 Tax=Phytohabitans maris TaxID=3071409 RepID=A0ABU0ZDK7_9ACTN|nr:SAF domain-containing protein [Phytohabitans sp. ZYX-F-186]MDQ7904400.1 SAF domain-containing protein [Phytohabitans sp. ZYX-F-186]